MPRAKKVLSAEQQRGQQWDELNSSLSRKFPKMKKPVSELMALGVSPEEMVDRLTAWTVSMYIEELVWEAIDAAMTVTKVA